MEIYLGGTKRRDTFDNNAESLFELQWVFAGTNVWGVGNSMVDYIAYSSQAATVAGVVKGSYWWIISQYEGLNQQPDGTLKGRTTDQRLHATYMLPGAAYLI
jgi:hypothetical protein